MTALTLPLNHLSIQEVGSFEELAEGVFENGINAFYWQRPLRGDFEEVVSHLNAQEGITPLNESQLKGLSLSKEGRIAVEMMLEDLHQLQLLEREPVLNLIDGYPRDEDPGPVATDVLSFHADSAPVEADTWLCTYHGAPSEGLLNKEAIRRVDIPATRAELLTLYEGPDDEGFREFLQDYCFDLHYAPLPEAQPYTFGMGNLWRIAVDWPGSLVPPCIHRAPDTKPGDPVRLMMIS
ncbi:MAG: hypothetical protein ACSHYB_11650 [Roseibacillus sp.]